MNRAPAKNPRKKFTPDDEAANRADFLAPLAVATAGAWNFDRRKEFAERFGVWVICPGEKFSDWPAGPWGNAVTYQDHLVFFDRARLWGFRRSEVRDGRVTITVDLTFDQKSLMLRLAGDLHQLKRKYAKELPPKPPKADVDLRTLWKVYDLVSQDKPYAQIDAELGLKRGTASEYTMLAVEKIRTAKRGVQ